MLWGKLLIHSGAANVRVAKLFTDPALVVGFPALLVGLFFDFAPLIGLGLSLLCCAIFTDR